MEKIRLFRKRFIPDESVELKDDKLLSASDKLLITKWTVLKPRTDIATGASAYFLDKGVKVSKFMDAKGALVYWYCDIVEPQINRESGIYTFVDLLIDVLVFPDGSVRVVDLDEFADMIEEGVLSPDLVTKALHRTNDLLQTIYGGEFSVLTKEIENI